jgi:antitoxin HicB
MTTKKIRSTRGLSTLDGFLEEEGTREKFQAVAIKEVLAWQIAEAMKAQGMSLKRLAERMGTSRSQITRLLDPKDGNVTMVTFQRAAELLGRKVGSNWFDRPSATLHGVVFDIFRLATQASART